MNFEKTIKKKFDVFKFLTIFSLFAIPFFVVLQITIKNNSDKFNNEFKLLISALLFLFVFLFAISFFKLLKDKRVFNHYNIKRKLAVLFFALSYSTFLFGIVNLVYYNDSFKEWLITSSIGSINYKHIAFSLYSDSIIKDVIDDNTEEVDLSKDVIDFSNIGYDGMVYANKYEEEILNRKEDAIYKVIKISGTAIGSSYRYEGYLVAVYDPSLVKVAKSSGAGTFEGAYGETLSVISKKNNALVAMNAGGFYDPDWNSNGGIPHGDVFIDGKLDSTYVDGGVGGGLIGFDKNNKLILKNMSSEEAKARGIRDGVEWGPFLIVDGVNKFKNVDYYTWTCARSAIGQRKDGIVLMLVIDGLQEHSKGASYADMAYIMEKYGAINAANLDGGTSSSMTVNHEYINSPWNGYVKTYRWLPNAWIVASK